MGPDVTALCSVLAVKLVSPFSLLTLLPTYSQVLDLTEQVLTKFGFTDYEIMLSTRPEKAVGSDEIWEQACIYAHAVLMWACSAHAVHMHMQCACCAHAV